MNKIQIDNPCSENWHEMKPEEQGRLCDKCCKVVMDFTSKTTEEILNTLKSATGKICGRISSDKLRPVPVFSKPLRRSKLFLFALLFAFGGMLFTSCARHKHTATQGDVRIYDLKPSSERPVNKGIESISAKNH
jgi:hypothetical protein